MSATTTLDNSNETKIKLDAKKALEIACMMASALPVCGEFTGKEVGKTKDDLFNSLKIHKGYSTEELEFVFDELHSNIIGAWSNGKIEKYFLYFWK